MIGRILSHCDDLDEDFPFVNLWNRDLLDPDSLVGLRNQRPHSWNGQIGHDKARVRTCQLGCRNCRANTRNSRLSENNW